VQSIAALAGVVFLLIGILGFVPGITTHYGSMSFAGHGSGARLLGVFQVSILHNLVHLLFGGGAVYLALWVIGLVGAAKWIPSNTAGDWSHFAFGIALIGLGAVATRRSIT
jgi:hypothetical protein